MRSVFYDMPVVEHRDFVAKLCTGKSVRNVNRRFSFYQLIKMLIDFKFRSWVQRSSRFVQYKYRRIFV